MLPGSSPYSGYTMSNGIHYIVTRKDHCDQSVDLTKITDLQDFTDVTLQMARGLAYAHMEANGPGSRFANEVVRLVRQKCDDGQSVCEAFTDEVANVATKFA